MIDVKEAVKVAHDYTRELYKDYGVGEVDPITLEEVELTDDERFWLITLGMYRSELPATTTGPVLPADTIAGRLLAKREREYKIVKIHADSGKVRSMKIREA
jgi:hypothetical protein